MTVTNDTIYQVLKSIQADVSPLRDAVSQLKTQAAFIREHMISTQSDVAKIYEKLAAHELRLASLEGRGVTLAAGLV